MITQIGKQLATQIVDTVHDVCGHDINFINKNGIIYASTNTSRIGSFHEIGKKAADTKTVIEVQDNDHYEGTSSGVNIPVTHNGYLIAVIGISGSPAEVRKFAYLAEKITRLPKKPGENFGGKIYFCARLPKLTTAVSPCSLVPNS